LFTNGPELFDEPYVRYLTRMLRDNFAFSEVTIKLLLRAKGEGSSRKSPLEDEGGTEPLAEEFDPNEDITVLRESEKPAKKSKRVKAELVEEASPAKPPKVPKTPKPWKKKPQSSETWDV